MEFGENAMEFGYPTGLSICIRTTEYGVRMTFLTTRNLVSWRLQLSSPGLEQLPPRFSLLTASLNVFSLVFYFFWFDIYSITTSIYNVSKDWATLLISCVGPESHAVFFVWSYDLFSMPCNSVESYQERKGTFQLNSPCSFSVKCYITGLLRTFWFSCKRQNCR